MPILPAPTISQAYLLPTSMIFIRTATRSAIGAKTVHNPAALQLHPPTLSLQFSMLEHTTELRLSIFALSSRRQLTAIFSTPVPLSAYAKTVPPSLVSMASQPRRSKASPVQLRVLTLAKSRFNDPTAAYSPSQTCATVHPPSPT